VQFLQLTGSLGLVFVFVYCLAFCMFFFWFILNCFVLMLFAFGVLDLVFFQRLARKNVSEMTYFVSSGT